MWWSASVLLSSVHVASPPEWVTYASLGTAVAAICVGIANRRIARRALDLSERQEERRESRLDIYLQDSFSRRRPAEGDRILAFHLLLANPTDRPTAVVEADLHLTYTTEGRMTTMKVRHAAENPKGLEQGRDFIAFPTRLDANAAASGWIVFQVVDALVADHAIDRYELFIRDVHGLQEGLQVTVIPEIGE
jgi:hypothetical protein